MGFVEKNGVRKTCFVLLAFLNDAITTTTSMMMFCIIYLIRYPQAQTRMRKEIHEIVGDSAMVSQSDADDIKFIIAQCIASRWTV